MNETTDTNDYSHRFHAGNVGDVFKHIVLLELLRCVGGGTHRVHYIESHAGEGGYALDTTGEWTEGIGKLWATSGYFVNDHTVSLYLEIVSSASRGARFYPGSPMVAAAVLGSEDRMTFWEKEPVTCGRLEKCFEKDTRVTVRRGDGIGALTECVVGAKKNSGSVVVLIDPPYSTKSEWITVPNMLVQAYAASTDVCFVLWYPLKSLTRPNAMIARIRDAGVRATVVEWTNTPLELKRNRLNGSGLILVRPPRGCVSRILAGLPAVADVCATHDGRWSIRVVNF
ncbi:MAG: 23S rRNA (adenine(2030)-N(6))-methyltransferase RlmJ [Myxococcales bacterium]|nr:23S rRNA (adenine(2030)-N(6))-methyltransferase RlmJ [Myxococcales bacterium]